MTLFSRRREKRNHILILNVVVGRHTCDTVFMAAVTLLTHASWKIYDSKKLQVHFSHFCRTALPGRRANVRLPESLIRLWCSVVHLGRLQMLGGGRVRQRSPNLNNRNPAAHVAATRHQPTQGHCAVFSFAVVQCKLRQAFREMFVYSPDWSAPIASSSPGDL